MEKIHINRYIAFTMIFFTLKSEVYDKPKEAIRKEIGHSIYFKGIIRRIASKANCIYPIIL